MKNFYTLLFFLLMFAVSANAEYVTEQFTFVKVSGNQSAHVDLDFSRYDLSTVRDFTFEFPLGLTSSFYFTNVDYVGDFEISAGTAYTGTLNYGLGITADTGHGTEPITLLDSTSTKSFDVIYTITDTVNLSVGNTYFTPFSQNTLLGELTVSTEEFLNLLDNDNHLNLSFILDKPKTSLNDFPYPAGISSGLKVENLAGEMKVSFEAVSVTPEPASLFIFGTAVILGVPFVQRFLRKRKN